ncbi:MAG: hypothetical protein PVI06_21095, partial [Desulfobacterales bacterium]
MYKRKAFIRHHSRGIFRLIIISLFGLLVTPGYTIAADESTGEPAQSIETKINLSGINPEKRWTHGEYGERFFVSKVDVENNMPAEEIPPPPQISEIFLDEGDYYLVRGKKHFIRRD